MKIAKYKAEIEALNDELDYSNRAHMEERGELKNQIDIANRDLTNTLEAYANQRGELYKAYEIFSLIETCWQNEEPVTPKIVGQVSEWLETNKNLPSK